MHRHHYRCYRPDAGAAERMVPAIVLIAIGGFFLLNNLHLVYFREVFQWWPALVIAYGVVKLVDSADAGGRVFGGLLTTGGGILLARNLGLIDIRVGELWPLILIGAGLMMLFQRTWPHPGAHAESGAQTADFSGNFLRESGVFSGGKRHITTTDFRGGKVEVVFGGFELDCTRAEIAGDSADLKIDAVFGGVEIRIPPHWNAVVKGTGVFGAFSDETLHPNPANFPQIKQLIVRGGAVFGGVVVKN